MGLDYYGILGLTKHCEDLDIKKAYRTKALENYKEGLSDQFILVAEAYDVLSVPCRRAIYDQYGEEGLKKGVPTEDGFIIPYIYQGDALKTFKDFFGVKHPYVDLIERKFSDKNMFDFPLGRGIRQKEPPLERPLALTLEEIFHGGVKKMKIQRNVFADDTEATTRLEEKILTIHIKRGLPSGTKFVFLEVGDQGHTIIPADVIFTTEDKPHPLFARNGLTLYTERKHITLEQALVGVTLPIQTLDQRLLQIPITQVVSPDYIKIVEMEGMPAVDEPTRRGDLIISFQIEFPKYITKSSKLLISRALKEPNIEKDKNLSNLYRAGRHHIIKAKEMLK